MRLCQGQRLPKMVNSGSPQTEIILDIWNILTTASGGTVRNVDSLQIKSARLRVPKVLFDSIPVLDAVIKGGIPRGFTVLVAGNPGTAKTILTIRKDF